MELRLCFLMDLCIERVSGDEFYVFIWVLFNFVVFSLVFIFEVYVYLYSFICLFYIYVYIRIKFILVMDFVCCFFLFRRMLEFVLLVC